MDDHFALVKERYKNPGSEPIDSEPMEQNEATRGLKGR